MLKISRSSVQKGMVLASFIAQCHDDFLECLWVRAEKCEECELVEFRKKFEEQSPAFFNLFRNLSNFESIMKMVEKDNLSSVPQQKYETIEKFHNLQTFAESSVLALFPLFKSNNDCFPFLKTTEIEEIQRDYLLCSPKKAEKELLMVSQDWYSSLAAIFTSFYGQEKDVWAKKVYLLIKVFLYGLEKEEKKFIKEIFPVGEGNNISDDVEKFLGIKKMPPKEDI